MSHELRTPLNAMLGFTQLMLRNQREPLSAGHRETMGNIERAGWHLLDMIDDILDLARIESGRLALNMASVPLHDEVRECMALLAMASQHQVALEFSCLPRCGCRPTTRLRQVLANLLSNAIKVQPAGRRVWITSAAKPPDARPCTRPGQGWPGRCAKAGSGCGCATRAGASMPSRPRTCSNPSTGWARSTARSRAWESDW
jgi:signal transduction histidine kinase